LFIGAYIYVYFTCWNSSITVDYLHPEETLMIANDECITQDQLITSANAGKVRVVYPRGSQTILAFGSNGQNVVDPTEHTIDKDGAWQQATVVNGGSGVLFLSDTPTSVPTVILGANLKAL
jgi:hypothetical protein